MDLIKEIFEKYLALESELDAKLEKIKHEELRNEKYNAAVCMQSAKNKNVKITTNEEAMTRNTNILKSLEMTKARLRSRSTFSPVEQILEKALHNYKRNLEPSQNHKISR